ncbi:bifunctional DNA-formamidopyrimidine glycosylase/DNA-(apurinic or apyrimidinic site) lyase [Magnetococcales bacterium HHB-1]
MPELPEVETIGQGLKPALLNKKVINLEVRQTKLRHPVPVCQLQDHIQGDTLLQITRRGKYLLFSFSKGWMILHFGMSGTVRQESNSLAPWQKHDHISWTFQDINSKENLILRYNDPRRFGAVLWHPGKAINHHPLIKNLGPEPFDAQFSYHNIQPFLTKRKIKDIIMDSRVVVGVGNIYASEALFRAGIHPQIPGKQLQKEEIIRLIHAIQATLKEAILAGGTTLRDFLTSEGKPGYFKQKLNVYGRHQKSCNRCGHPIERVRWGGRASYFCPQCQQY